jgi:serine/threonine protein kinase
MPLDSPLLQSIGSYDILSKIAEGGMGTVYKGRHRGTGQVVAIKIVPPTAARNPTLLKRFEREFTAAHALEHPNIVKAIEFDGECPTPFLVMEFVDGETVGQRIERDGKMPEDDAVRIIAQVCQGLYRAHKQGLVHRDVKPDNILVSREGHAKLTDLGLVKDAAEDFNLTRTGRGLGTPHFMAPEQFKHAKYADARCDIYSLGATLYMMVTGQTPFGNCNALDCFLKKSRNELPPPRQIVPELSERVDWAIRRSMSPTADQRPASCREFVEDLIGRSTRPSQQGVVRASGEVDLWYLIYKDEEGTTHTVKGERDGIRGVIKDGLLGDASTVTACRTKQGPFLALKEYPEFRDLLIKPEAVPPVQQPPPKPVTKMPTPAPRATPVPKHDRTPKADPVPKANDTPRADHTPKADLKADPTAVQHPAAKSASPAPPPPKPTPKPAPPPAKPAPPPRKPDPTPVPVVDPSLPAWRQAATGGSASQAGFRLPGMGRVGFDVIMWVLVMLASLGAALAVFHYFPPA